MVVTAMVSSALVMARRCCGTGSLTRPRTPGLGTGCIGRAADDSGRDSEPKWKRPKWQQNRRIVRWSGTHGFGNQRDTGGSPAPELGRAGSPPPEGLMTMRRRNVPCLRAAGALAALWLVGCLDGSVS